MWARGLCDCFGVLDRGIVLDAGGRTQMHAVACMVATKDRLLPCFFFVRGACIPMNYWSRPSCVLWWRMRNVPNSKPEVTCTNSIRIWFGLLIIFVRGGAAMPSLPTRSKHTQTWVKQASEPICGGFRHYWRGLPMRSEQAQRNKGNPEDKTLEISSGVLHFMLPP